ncbi:integrase core domain-containing protein [Flagellimonas sp. 389]|uniref:integrase core domain-containing protein n=1 Tax=Flagellimonas sp. 389 TaxID=2835862 RepID=UPI003530043D
MLSDQWRDHYNEKRPHEALQNLTPKDFLTNYGKASFSISKNELNCTNPTVAN